MERWVRGQVLAMERATGCPKQAALLSIVLPHGGGSGESVGQRLCPVGEAITCDFHRVQEGTSRVLTKTPARGHISPCPGRASCPQAEPLCVTMFSKLRSKPQSSQASKPASSPSMHKQRASAKSASSPSMRQSQSAERRPSFSEHQWDERQWTKPFAAGTTQVMATLRFPPEQDDAHDLRRIPEEDDLYGRAQEHSNYKGSPKCGSVKASPAVSSKTSKHSSRKTSASSMAKSSASSLKSTAPSTRSISTITSKASASSLWSERPSSSSSNATYATSWSVDSSASTVMTDLDEPISECNSNRPDSCTLGDYDVFKARAKKEHPKRPNSNVSSCSGTSCAGTIYSRPQTGKSSKTGDIAFQVVAEESDAIYLQRTPNPRPRRRWG